jgi:hypothetical protein
VTVYESDAIEIPGLGMADATTGYTVDRTSSETWNDFDPLVQDVATGLWKKGGFGPVVADGNTPSGDLTGPVKILPYIEVGMLGMNRGSYLQGLSYARATAALTRGIPTTGAGIRWPILVEKVSGEAWTVGTALQRVDAVGANLHKYTTGFPTGWQFTGCTVAADADSDATQGYISVDILIKDVAGGSSGIDYQADIVEVHKLIAETWSVGSNVYSDGYDHSTQSTAGWVYVGRAIKPASAGSTLGYISRTYDLLVDGWARLLHIMRLSHYILVPQNTLNRVFWRTEMYYPGFGGFLTDDYFLNFRNYTLTQPMTQIQGTGITPVVANSSFPGIAIDLPDPVSGSGTWNMPSGMAVIWAASNPQQAAITGGSVIGMMYAKDTTDFELSATSLPMTLGVAAAEQVFRASERLVLTNRYEGTFGQYAHLTRRGPARRVYMYSQGVAAVTPSFKVQQLVVDQSVVGATKSAWQDLTSVTMTQIAVLGADALYFGETAVVGDANLLSRHLRVTTGGGSVIPAASWHLDNLGVLPFEFDVPRWVDTIKPTEDALETKSYLGAYLEPPESDLLTWAGGYALSAALVSGHYVVTIAGTRHSVIGVTDTEKYTKVTTWCVESVSPVDGTFPFSTNPQRAIQPRRVPLTVGSTTLDSWNDVVAFTSTTLQLGNPTDDDITYQLVIVARTVCSSRYHETSASANQYVEEDRVAISVTIPPTG